MSKDRLLEWAGMGPMVERLGMSIYKISDEHSLHVKLERGFQLILKLQGQSAYFTKLRGS